ncbi:MAG: phospholipid carrier-dependent glycosyltransferase [Planctomycetes bacterium]|nr:phospholipid carrier-dependent glycosyltransferase [Planctomycetota bacterium]
MHENEPRRASALLGLFAFLAALFLLTGGGHVYSGDGHTIYQTTRAMVERGELAIDPGDYVYGARGPEGKFYGKFGIGQSVAAIPFYLAAKGAAAAMKSLGSEALARKSESDLCLPVTYTLNQFVTAAAVAVFCAILLALGFSLRGALLSGLALGLSTTLWPYAKYFLSEPLLMLCLLLAFLAALRHCRGGGALSAAAAGLFLGCACLVKISGIVALPVFLIYLAQRAGKGRRARAAVLFCLPVAAALGVFLYLNYIRFGGPFETGYAREGGLFSTAILEGVRGQLLSPGKSVFLFSPLLAAAVLLLFTAARRFFPETLFCALLFLAFLFFHGAYHAWQGGYCWGPRYLVAVVPFAFFPVALGIERAAAARGFISGVLRALLLPLFFLGLAVQLLGVLANYHDYDSIFLKEVEPGFTGSSWDLMSWSFERSHLAANAYLLRDGSFDLWFVHFWREGIPPAILLATVLLLVLALLLGARAVRSGLAGAPPVAATAKASDV